MRQRLWSPDFKPYQVRLEIMLYHYKLFFTALPKYYFDKLKLYDIYNYSCFISIFFAPITYGLKSNDTLLRRNIVFEYLR